MMSFTHCNGCCKDSVENVATIASKMKERGVDVVHLSSCVRSKCPFYDEFLSEISKNIEVVGYTHAKGNKTSNIEPLKIEPQFADTKDPE